MMKDQNPNSSFWQKHKGKIIGFLFTTFFSFLTWAGTYVYTAVNYYQTEEEAKATRAMIVEEILKPETLQKVLADSNVVKAQKAREDAIVEKALENTVAHKQPDSLKLSTKLIISMDLKRSQKPEEELAWTYEQVKILLKEIEKLKEQIRASRRMRTI